MALHFIPLHFACYGDFLWRLPKLEEIHYRRKLCARCSWSLLKITADFDPRYLGEKKETGHFWKYSWKAYEIPRLVILRGITGASKSSPATALGALIGLEPLHLTIAAEASKAAWRIGENSSTVISKKLRATGDIAKRPVMKMMRDRMSPRYHFDKKYKVSLSTMEDWKAGRAHLPGDEDNWFTDGSKNREGAGAGVYGRNSNTSLAIPLGPHLTVLQTEIAAILQCAYKARNNGRGRNIRICSVSRAAITTIGKLVTTSTTSNTRRSIEQTSGRQPRYSPLDPWSQGYEGKWDNG